MPPGVYELRRDAPTGIWCVGPVKATSEGTGTRLFIEHDGLTSAISYQATSRRILGALAASANLSLRAPHIAQLTAARYPAAEAGVHHPP